MFITCSVWTKLFFVELYTSSPDCFTKCHLLCVVGKEKSRAFLQPSMNNTHFGYCRVPLFNI